MSKYIDKLATIAQAIVNIVNTILGIFNVELDTGINFNEDEIGALKGDLTDLAGAFSD